MAATKNLPRTRIKRANPVLASPTKNAPAEPIEKQHSADDRKLITLRLTYAQRRHLQKIAFDEETSVQEWIVSAIEARLRSKGMSDLASVKV